MARVARKAGLVAGTLAKELKYMSCDDTFKSRVFERSFDVGLAFMKFRTIW